MGTYRKEWDCCGSVTETQAWEPEDCPFCATPPSPSTAPTEQDQANVLPPFAAPAGQHDADLHDVIEFALSLSEKEDAWSALGFLSAWNWETDDYVRAQWPEFAEFELASRGRAQGGNTSAKPVESGTAEAGRNQAMKTAETRMNTGFEDGRNSVESGTAPTVEVDERAAFAVGLRLPALPRAVAVGWKGASMAELADGYTARQMRAYGEACARAALASKPLAREADQQPMKGTSE